MTKTSPVSDKVDFRWRQHEAVWKTRMAVSAAKANRSIGDHARELIKTALVADEQTLLDIQLLRQEIANLDRRLGRLAVIEAGSKAIHENVYQLRDDLLVVVIKLLTDAGCLDQPEAETWVEQTVAIQSNSRQAWVLSCYPYKRCRTRASTITSRSSATMPVRANHPHNGLEPEQPP
jgi:hypothetical protein